MPLITLQPPRYQRTDSSCTRFRNSFICQGTSIRKQWSELFGLRVKLPPVTTSSNHSKVEAILLNALLKDMGVGSGRQGAIPPSIFIH